jgi:hypothetical protein
MVYTSGLKYRETAMQEILTVLATSPSSGA